MSLDQMRLCRACRLRETAQQVVPPSGGRNPIILFIGEAPGWMEDRDGKPFVGKSGQELRAAARDILRLAPTDYALDNVVRCHPTNDRDPSAEEIAACSYWLEEVILDRRPEIIIPVGAFAMRWFMGKGATLDIYHGIPRRLRQTAHGPFSARHGYDPVVFPIYHPAAGMGDQGIFARIRLDLQLLYSLMKSHRLEDAFRVDKWPEPEYLEVAQGYEEELVEDLKEATVWAIDTESCGDAPWGLTVSVMPGRAWFVPATDMVSLNMLRVLMGSLNPLVVMHNALYDIPVLAKMGIEVKNPACSMVGAYLLGTEPLGLKALASRYASMEMTSYDEMLGEIGKTLAVEYLQQIAAQEWPDSAPIPISKEEGAKMRHPWNIGRKALQILKDTSSKEADPRERWHNVDPVEKAVVINEMGKMPEPSIDMVEHGHAVQYACRDADATIRVWPFIRARLETLSLGSSFQRDMGIIPIVADMEETGVLLDTEALKGLSEWSAGRKKEIEEAIKPYVFQGVINLGSPLQVADLLFTRLGIEPRRRTKTGQLATDHETLLEIEHEHPVVPLLLEHRMLSKIKDTYADVLPGKVRGDGRLHPRIHTTRVETGRLSMSDPNLMNLPQRTELGRRVREAIIAPEGCKLLSLDYSQIELRVAAHVSGDRGMIETFIAGEDIHRKTASLIFRLSPDAVTDEQRYLAKTINFGILYGISSMGLSRQLLATGRAEWTEEACANLIHGWFAAYPGIRDYVEHKKAEARRFGYVRDFLGRIYLTSQVMSVHEYIQAAADRFAVNAPIQGGAQGIIKEAMGKLPGVYWRYQHQAESTQIRGRTVFNVVERRCVPLLQIHDELLFEVEDSILVPFAKAAKATMESAVPLSVPTPVGVAVGQSWGKMEDLEL